MSFDIQTLGAVLVLLGWLTQLGYAVSKHRSTVTKSGLVLMCAGMVVMIVDGFNGFTLQAIIQILTAGTVFILLLRL